MFDMIDHLFHADSLSPHGICLLWRPELIWTHVISDAIIAASYFSIPFVIASFVMRRRGFGFPWVLWCFAAFILACGTTHILAIWTIWTPVYGIEALAKAATALASLVTAAALWIMLPKALSLPSPADMHNANTVLKRREAELTAILDNVPVLIGYWDRNTRLQMANNYHSKWFGKPMDELIGIHSRDLLGEELDSKNRPEIEKALAGVQQQFERRFPRSTPDEDRHCILTYVPDFRDGSVIGFFGLIQDITEHRKSEDRLAASLAFQERAGRVAGIGAWAMDLETRTVTFSPQAYRIHDLAPGTPIDHDTAMGFYPQAARHALEATVAAAIARGTTWDLQLPFVTAAGRSRWIRTAGEVEYKDGAPFQIVGTILDITAEHEANRLIREKEEQYRLLAENASDMIVRVKLDGTRVYVSPASRDLIGFDPEDLVGTPCMESVHPQDVARLEDMMRALRAGTKTQATIVKRLRHTDGRWIWAEANWRLLQDAAGAPLEFVVAIRNIDARHNAEEALQASETQYRTLADALPQMVWIISADDKRMIYGNKQFRTYYGAIDTAQDARFDRCHPDDREDYEAAIRVARASGKPFDREVRLRRHDGAYRSHKIVAMPIWRSDRIVEWVGTALDIDDIAAARQKLMETSDLLNLSQAAAGAGVFDFDLVSGSVLFSGESAIMHGFDGKTPIRIHRDDLKARIHPDDRLRVERLVQDACIDRITYSAEYRALLDGGRLRWIHGTGRAKYDAAGHATRMVGLNFDITTRKASETKLIEAIGAADEARRDAEQASIAKSEFLASMSHEIRTPLNSIIGYTDLIIDENRYQAEDRRRLSLIRDAGAALLTVVNDILDFSKIEAGQIELIPSTFHFRSFIENVMSIIGGIATGKPLSIDYILAPDMPAIVSGDSNRLRQILLNLLNNAVKFTETGHVRLVVRLPTSASTNDTVLFLVEDTGIGIAPDNMPRLFQRFSQADGSIDRRYGGSGLGLAISSKLVEMMGGDIGVESVEGHGSTFWFTVVLPVAEKTPADLVAMQSDAESRAASARILLVEDIVVNQDLVRIILQAMGHSVDVAANGLEAIAKVHSGDYDVVLMDIHMPGMDGVTATRRIRALETAARSVPIIAMTANVLPHQIAEFKNAGMNDHIGKPFKRAELLARIDSWAGTRSPERPVETGYARAEAAGEGGDVAAIDLAILKELKEMVGDAVCEVLIEKFDIEVMKRFGSMPKVPDRGRLQRDVHAIMASAGSLGFTGLAALCRRVEAACQDGGDLSFCVAALEDAGRRVHDKVASMTRVLVK